MPKFTTFLQLTLPEKNEFLDAWHIPVNQNMEDLDDWLSDLHLGLIGTGSSSLWATLRGTLPSLADRLAVSLNSDGTLNVSNSPAVMNMATSAVEGAFADPQTRLDTLDFYSFDARQPVAGGRFAPIPAAGPTAASPPERLDPGIALRSADFGANAAEPISSPQKPWAPGLVIGGASPFITGLGIGQVRITADTPPAIFNIDGYIFRLREIIDFDWTALAPANNDYVWIYVDRNEAGYNNANFKYTAPGGGAAAAKDLRKLQSGNDGVTSGSTFSAASGLFNTAPFGKVKPGDTLVITSGAAAGSYVINALDGVTPDSKFTVRGKLKAASAGVSWYILDNAQPNIGAVVTGALVTTKPPFVPGRVYIARAQHNTAGNPTNIVTFQPNGVWDSGWTAVDAATDFPLTLTHDLGVVPSSVEVWCRLSAAATEIYRPLVKRSVVTDTAGPTSASFLVEAMQLRCSDVDLKFRLMNASTVPLKAAAIFTDSADADQSVCEIRVIAKR